MGTNITIHFLTISTQFTLINVQKGCTCTINKKTKTFGILLSTSLLLFKRELHVHF